MIFEQSGTFPLDWISSSVINALFIGGLTWGGDLYIYIYIREESRGGGGEKKVYSSGTMLLQGWLLVSRSRRPYITRVSPLRVLSTRGRGDEIELSRR